MLFATVNLQLFTGAQIHKAITALGFQNEVQLFFSILGQIHRPVGIVRSNRCIDLEPVWNFEEHFYIGIIVQCQGEGALYRAAVIYNVIVNTVFNLYRITIQIGNQLSGIENLLDIVFLSVQFHIADTVNRQSMAVVFDQLNGFFKKSFRVIQKVL